MEENREMMELMQKIEKSSRQQARSGWVLCVFNLITGLCCAAMLLLILNLVPQINTMVTQAETVLTNLEQTTAQLAAIDLEGMVTDVDTLVSTGQESLEQTMEKLNTIDIETLNQAIADLAAVIDPLAEFFSVFG